MYPQKCVDAEWGQQWEGPIFGVHIGHGGSVGQLAVGSRVTMMPAASLSYINAVLRAVLGPRALFVLPVIVILLSWALRAVLAPGIPSASV